MIFGGSVIFSSCNEKETIGTNGQQDMLMRHTWKHYQARTVSVDAVTNTVVKDTMYLVDSCYQNSLYVFAADSMVRRNFICFSAPTEREGRWYLKADSTFAGSVMIRTYYGSGYILQDFVLPSGKMKLLTETDFQMQSSSGGFTFGSIKVTVPIT